MKPEKAVRGKKPHGKIVRSLIDFFGGPDEGKEKLRSRFEIAIEEMEIKKDSVIMGRMHMINLRNLVIRRKNPEKELERAELAAEAVIDRNLGDGDVFTRGGEGAFYILFQDMNEAAGKVKCAVIGDQIAELLGKEDSVFRELVLKTTVETVGRNSLQKAMAARSAGRRPRPAAGREKRGPTTARVGNPSKRTLDRDPTGDTVTRDEPAAAPVQDALEDQETIAPRPEGMSVMYGTIWNVKTKMLTAYNCTLMVREADGKPVRFRFKHRAEHYRQTLFAIDRYTQKKATARLRELLQSGQEALVVLPVHFMTVNEDASSLLYRQRLADLSDLERCHIVLELVDLPRDLSGVWVGKISRTMRRVARTVMIRTPIDTRNLDSWRDTGVHAVGFDLGTIRIDRQGLLPKLERFAEHAEENGLRTFVYGIDTISEAALAVSAGIDYVEGAAVCAPVESIEHVKPFETQDLLSQILP